MAEEAAEKKLTFKDLGVVEELCLACERLGWKEPTAIQREAIPLALQDKDVIGLAETGSGKTGAFGLPLLQALIARPQRLFGLVLTPTRELAFQIKEQFEALGRGVGVTCVVIVGGMDMTQQALELAKRPHLIVATPGRLVDHLEKTKGFNMRALKYLVMDEADRILNLDFEEEVDKILKELPRERRTMLFSATMTSKVNKLQRAHLRDPVKVEVSSKYQTVSKLKQYMLFVPCKHKHMYLIHILNEIGSQSVMVFCSTQLSTLRTALMLRNLGFTAIPLYGKMSQNKRLGALSKFKARERSILLATDVASRGLDIPLVDYVINFDVPMHSKNYIHRVGRTARAGKAGVAITLVSQYEVEVYQRIEELLNTRLEVYPVVKEEVMVLEERVAEAERFAKIEMSRLDEKGGRKGGRKRGADDDDGEGSMGVRNRINNNKNKNNNNNNSNNNRKKKKFKGRQ
ncbi:probable ATP-dependent RNA helicase DDX47 [Eriocheir sinensis]|uniref:probable ATP-dependent RNA helicase DDX47 n=1 Tax=Eriocheir sinensis TaxID=95602 RepID=UPI0021C8972C|nr:probable ATP-dependent RNA helicase DDX47 [Eriocheir sinensis]